MSDTRSDSVVVKTDQEVLAASRTPEAIERRRRLKEMSDEEILRRAREDPDAQPLTDEELAEMRAVNPKAFLAAREVLDQLEDADEAVLAEVLAVVAARLNARIVQRQRQEAA